jgi:hypothetical protein
MMLVAAAALAVGLSVGALIVVLAVDATRHDRASRKRAVVLRETVPILPWPHRDQTPRTLRSRTDVGTAEGTFLRRLTILCLIVVLLAGGCVHLIGQAIPDRQPRGPELRKPSPDTSQVHKGGDGRGGRS